MLLDRLQGSLLGLALGDAFGASFEGGVLERGVWWLIGKTRHGKRRWTDDTQMSLDLAESLLARKRLDADDLATRFASSYRWSRGYGPAAARLLKRIRRGEDWQVANRAIYPEGSFGNGGAMRAPVIGLFYAHRPQTELIEAARLSARITHAHPQGMEGAVLLAVATAASYRNAASEDILAAGLEVCPEPAFQSRLTIARDWLEHALAPTPREVARKLGNRVAARDSCVTAIYLALRNRERSFRELLNDVIRCGGDVDTIGAMAGAIWGATNGLSQLPEEWLEQLEARERMIQVATDLQELVFS